MPQFHVETGGRMGKTRKKRTPNFPVMGTMRPFGLYPVCVHPVLPGETLNSFTLKWRVISMPIKHPLAGAWLETWLCYVKMTDIDRDLGQQFISDNFATTGYVAAATNDRYFTKAGQIDWIKLCSERIHEAYFMDDGETPRSIDSVRMIKTNNNTWSQNMIFRPDDDALDTTDVLDANTELNHFMMMQQMAMSELDYESYLQQYGVRSIRPAEGDPEVFRYAPSWTVPVNTVEPTTGAPSSAWVWSQTTTAEKPKRFSEPGFVIMMAAFRPKLYNRNLRYSLCGELWGFSDWYPVYNLEDPTAGIKEIVTDNRVFATAFRTDAGEKNLLYDHRDLLSHGEQFVNNFSEIALEERVSFSNSIHADFLNQIEALMSESDLTDEDRQKILANLSCPCCGGSAASFTVRLDDED